MMEVPVFPPRIRQSFGQNKSSACTALNLADSPPTTAQKLNKLCNLPDLEILPVTKPGSKRSITESNDRTISVEAETSTDGNLKKGEMENLLKQLPILNQYFQLHSKIGKGTFSTVYLATLRNSTSNKSYAVKHITHKSQKLRINAEFNCMIEIGGRDNVVHVDYFFANGDDCVTFIMPYLPHNKFNDYVLDMNADETRLYMKNLFIALKRVHSFNIIHRDVKPGNFLYNRETKQFLLVDFGLAQVVQNLSSDTKDEIPGTDENMPIDYSKKRKRKDSVSDKEKMPLLKRNKRTALKSKDSNVRLSDGFGNVQLLNSDVSVQHAESDRLDSKSPLKQCLITKASLEKTPLKCKVFNMANQIPVKRERLFDENSPEGKLDQSKAAKEKQEPVNFHFEGRMATTSNSGTPQRDKSFTPLVANKSSSGSFVQVRNSRVVRQCEMVKSRSTEVFQKPRPRNSYYGEQCSCSGRGAICAICSSRSKMVAPRAGTPGFRPPEVLFKHVNQTTAVDMWASGVILLCILSGCYPFFKSPNDLVALAEIMTVFGTEPIIKIAAKFGRRVVCSNKRKGVDLKKLCKILRARNTKKTTYEKSPNDVKCENCFQTIRADGCLCISDNPKEEKANETDSSYGFPDSAFDLLQRLLDLDPTTRITAAEALEHPFILGL